MPGIGLFTHIHAARSGFAAAEYHYGYGHEYQCYAGNDGQVEFLVEELIALLQRPHAHLGDLESVRMSLRHREFRQTKRVLDAFNTF